MFQLAPSKSNRPYTIQKIILNLRTRTSSSISEPVFDWASICIDRIGHFKDSMALRCVSFHPNQDELIFGSNGSSLRLCTNLNDLARDPIQPVFTLDQIHEASGKGITLFVEN